jgi:hypothetical protein
MNDEILYLFTRFLGPTTGVNFMKVVELDSFIPKKTEDDSDCDKYYFEDDGDDCTAVEAVEFLSPEGHRPDNCTSFKDSLQKFFRTTVRREFYTDMRYLVVGL